MSNKKTFSGQVIDKITVIITELSKGLGAGIGVWDDIVYVGQRPGVRYINSGGLACLEGIRNIQGVDIDSARELGYRIKLLGMTKYENGISRSQLQREFDLGDGQFERLMHRMTDEHKDVFYDRRSIPRLYKTNPLYNKEIEDTASKAVDLISLSRNIKKQKELILA